jgi:hypothetical protein
MMPFVRLLLSPRLSIVAEAEAKGRHSAGPNRRYCVERDRRTDGYARTSRSGESHGFESKSCVAFERFARTSIAERMSPAWSNVSMELPIVRGRNVTSKSRDLPTTSVGLSEEERATSKFRIEHRFHRPDLQYADDRRSPFRMKNH